MPPTIVTIRAGVQFTPQAAASFRRAETDLGRRIQTNSTYRDWAQQLLMYTAWQRYLRGGPKPAHSMAIHPDLSMHCKGLAMDSNEWTDANFNTFMADRGWIRTAASDPTERHHYEYQSSRDKHINRLAGGGGQQIEDDMPTPADLWEFKMSNPVTGGVDTAGNFLRYTATVAAAIESVPRRVWEFALAHPDGGGEDTAGNFVRYNGRTQELIRQILARPAAVVDTGKLASELIARGMQVGLTREDLEAALDASLSDDFAAIATETADEIDRRDRERLSK